MRNLVLALGLIAGLSVAFGCGAVAKPVTAHDLAGRTICYNNGEKATYFPDGKYQSSMLGKGTWTIISSGVWLKAEQFNGILDFEIQPDKSISIPKANMTGKYCSP